MKHRINLTNYKKKSKAEKLIDLIFVNLFPLKLLISITLSDKGFVCLLVVDVYSLNKQSYHEKKINLVKKKEN